MIRQAESVQEGERLRGDREEITAVLSVRGYPQFEDKDEMGNEP